MNRTALVTGASRGLGATLARLLAGRGFDLVLSARTGRDLERVAGELRADGATVLARPGDLSDPFTWQTLVDAAEYIGGLDVLVNNASILGSRAGFADGLAPLTDVDASQLERVLRVNLVAPLALTRATVPLLARKRGLVVNISSDAAVGAYPGWGAYGASKAALDLATRTLAAELSPQGVAVVSVDPGDMRTRMHQQAFPAEDISDRPLPEVTVPFWHWLLEQDGPAITGRRFQAQTVREEWAASA
jgi:NAD(P)-dependent dehydrogenase (short-subunit alcohol dehydrogenase family)